MEVSDEASTAVFRRTATTAFTKSASFPAFAFFTTQPMKKEPLADS